MLPLKIDLFELINFFNFIHLQLLIFLDLPLEYFEVGARLGKLLVVLRVILFIFDLHPLNLLVKLVAFNLIISYGFICNSKFLLTVLKILLPGVNLLLQVLKSLLITLAVILERIHAGLLLVHLFLENALPAI